MCSPSSNHELIQLMRDVLHEVAPEVIIITETNVPTMKMYHTSEVVMMKHKWFITLLFLPLLVHSILNGNTKL